MLVSLVTWIVAGYLILRWADIPAAEFRRATGTASRPSRLWTLAWLSAARSLQRELRIEHVDPRIDAIRKRALLRARLAYPAVMAALIPASVAGQLSSSVLGGAFDRAVLTSPWSLVVIVGFGWVAAIVLTRGAQRRLMALLGFAALFVSVLRAWTM